MVLIAGAELFTGNVMISLSAMEGKTTYKKMLRNWAIVYFSNLIGALIIATLVYYSNLWKANHDMTAYYAIKIAEKKIHLTFTEAFTRGIMCNWLVCLAVWMSYGAKDLASKVAVIILPITIFIASGFEHSVANMFYIPKAMMLNYGLGGEVANITMDGFINNLIPVTLGNIVGAVVFISIAYKVAYLKKEK